MKTGVAIANVLMRLYWQFDGEFLTDVTHV